MLNSTFPTKNFPKQFRSTKTSFTKCWCDSLFLNISLRQTSKMHQIDDFIQLRRNCIIDR